MKVKNVRVSNKRMRQHQHLLDVTVRQSKERLRRARTIFFGAFKVVFIIALIVGSVVGIKEALRRFVWENPDYLLSDITYRTDGTLTREDVLKSAGVVEGVNIFKLDISAVRDAIAALPPVDRVEVQRLLPNRMTIRIVERNPIAWVTNRADEDPITSERAYLIDAHANAMKPRGPRHQFIHLPMISGFPVENLADGQRVTDYKVQAALELVRLNADNTRWQIKNVDVATGYSLIVTDNRRIKLTFNLDGLAKQLSRLDALFTRLGDREKELQTVNLFGERNTYITYQPPVIDPTAPEPPPGASKPGAKGSTPAPSRKPEATPATRKASVVDRVKQPFRTNGKR
jgi:cell division septal protein FtsQ